MSHIAYYRVSTSDQSIEAQRQALIKALPSSMVIDKDFYDEGVSGATRAADRPGFRALLEYMREGDTLHVYAVDRLGRDAIDVQATIRAILAKGVQVDICGLGVIGKGVGELIVAVLAQVAEMERERIRERTATGRSAARAALAATGRTHRGKESLGRPVKVSPASIREWRAANGADGDVASIRQTAEHFGISDSTVKRACAEVAA
jgi:putative DNA-invertase from lambdoid prophage Rac